MRFLIITLLLFNHISIAAEYNPAARFNAAKQQSLKLPNHKQLYVDQSNKRTKGSVYIRLTTFGILIYGCSIAPWNDTPPDLGLSKNNKFVLVSRNSAQLEMIFIPPEKREIKQDFFWYYLDLNFSPPTAF